MGTVDLSAQDRERMDALIAELERFSCRDTDVLVSCTEAARLLHKSPVTISAMIRQGRLKKVTIGQSTGIRLSEVREQAAGMR